MCAPHPPHSLHPRCSLEGGKEGMKKKGTTVEGILVDGDLRRGGQGRHQAGLPVNGDCPSANKPRAEHHSLCTRILSTASLVYVCMYVKGGGAPRRNSKHHPNLWAVEKHEVFLFGLVPHTSNVIQTTGIIASPSIQATLPNDGSKGH